MSSSPAELGSGLQLSIFSAALHTECHAGEVVIAGIVIVICAHELLLADTHTCLNYACCQIFFVFCMIYSKSVVNGSCILFYFRGIAST